MPIIIIKSDDLIKKNVSTTTDPITSALARSRRVNSKSEKRRPSCGMQVCAYNYFTVQLNASAFSYSSSILYVRVCVRVGVHARVCVASPRVSAPPCISYKYTHVHCVARAMSQRCDVVQSHFAA